MIDRKFRILLLAFAAGSALAGCGRKPASPETGAVIGEVHKDALDVVAAYNAQDAHKAAAYDAPDYVGVYHGSPNTVGPAADEAGMKAQMAAAKVDWKLGGSRVTIAESGDLAVFEAPYTFVVAMPNGATSEHGTWIAIFRRQDDGSMKLWRSIASDIPAPKATAS
jgi:ketosteroid isomerase-like protein